MKMMVIFEFPRFDITHDIWWYLPLGPQAPPHPGAALVGVRGGLSFKLETLKLPTILGLCKKSAL